MPLLGAGATLSLGVNLGVSDGTAGSGTPSAPTNGTPSTPSAPSTPSTPSRIPSGETVAQWKIVNGETIYLNTRPGSLGGTAWVDYQVSYVFADGNAVLTKEPNFVAYTGDMAVGINLRRKSEMYSDPYPGP